MPRTSNGASKHTLTIHFTEPEDLELHTRIVELAKAERREPRQYALLVLHSALQQTDTPSK